MRELIDLLSVVFSPTGTETAAGGTGAGAGSTVVNPGPSPSNPQTSSSSAPEARVTADIAGVAASSWAEVSPRASAWAEVPPRASSWAEVPPRPALSPSGSVLAAAAAVPPFVMPGTAPGVESPAEIARLAAASLASAGATPAGGAGAGAGGGAGGAGQAPPRRSVSTAPGSGGGFWRYWPLFRVYEPDPAAVVPRGGAGWEEAVVGSAAKAKVKEDAESRLRVSWSSCVVLRRPVLCPFLVVRCVVFCPGKSWRPPVGLDRWGCMFTTMRLA